MADSDRKWNTPSGFQAAAESAIPLPQIHNSLTDTKQTIVPVGGPSSKQLTWYECGPTVYDSAHMGHARNYVTFDIVRRILEDYFGYSMLYGMNVTDVDDKIIKRAKRNYLLQQYQKHHSDSNQVGAAAGMFDPARFFTQPFSAGTGRGKGHSCRRHCRTK